MKYKAVAAILFAGTLAFLAPRPASAAWSVSISYFHQELSPYGRWVFSASYGEVWHPTVVSAGWAPYLYGEWAYTDYGWTWVSHDPFGPDPFHYGTWVWIDPYGWCWVPGYVWGPAWVTWAYSDFYIGWACLPPSFEITEAGYAGSPIAVSQNQYIFVPVNSFIGASVTSVRVPVQQNASILTSANKATRFSVSGGIVRATDPPASFVQRVTGKTLHRASLSSDKLRATTIAAAGVVSGKRVRIVAPAHERRIAASGGKPSQPKVARHAGPSDKSVREPSRKSMREATAKSATTSRRPTRALKEKPSGGKPASAGKAVKAPRTAPSAHAKAAAAPRRTTRAVKEKPSAEKAVRAPRKAPSAHAKAAAAPSRIREAHARKLATSTPQERVERRSSAATRPGSRDIHRERPSAPAPKAVERRSENPPPAIRHEERPGPAAPPHVSQARSAPPPAAVAKPSQQSPAQPPPQPRGQPGGGKKEKQKE